MLQEVALLREAGHDTRLIVIDNDQLREWGAAKRALLPARTLWSTKSYKFVTSMVREVQPDIVHVHNTFPLASPSVFWAARRSGVPVVHTLANYRIACPVATFTRSGGVCEDCLGRSFAWPGVVHKCYRGSALASAAVASTYAFHRAIRTWEAAVDVFLVGSEFARHKLIEAGLPADRIVTKPNTAPDPGSSRSALGRNYVFAGRLTEEKGVSVLIDAWRRAQLRPDSRLILLGEGPDRSRLEQRAAGSSREVAFLGHVPRDVVRDHLLTARALISPSIGYEVSGISIVEALAAGVPCVVADSGAQADIVIHGLNGLLFRRSDASSLAKMLTRLDDDHLCSSLGVGARDSYTRHHSGIAVVSCLEAAYQLAAERNVRRTLGRRPRENIPWFARCGGPRP